MHTHSRRRRRVPAYNTHNRPLIADALRLKLLPTRHPRSHSTPQHQHGCPSGGSGLMGLKRKNRRAATSLKTLGPLITLLPECDELTKAGGAWSGLPARPLVVSRHDKVLSLG